MRKQITYFVLIIILFIIIISGTVPNPYILTYDKQDINKYIPKKYYLKESSINNPFFPSVIKPLYGSKGKGVMYIKNKNELTKYLQKNSKNCFLQEYYGDKEAGVYYYKDPFTNKVQIITTLKDSSIWPTRCGNKFFKPDIPLCTQTKTPKKLREAIIEISKKIPNFYIGRYDIRYYKDKDLDNGNFKIIELNHKMAGDGIRFQTLNLRLWSEHIYERTIVGIYNYRFILLISMLMLLYVNFFLSNYFQH